jgi:3-hydroxyisobutyrate dehydrogenase-like beta-hydroxyacid dehydrogenase
LQLNNKKTTKDSKMLSSNFPIHLRLLSSKVRFASNGKIGFVGLGHMGSKMALNLAQDGHNVVILDKSSTITAEVTKTINSSTNRTAAEAAKKFDDLMKCSTIFSMLPNDDALRSLSQELLSSTSPNTQITHISCSTVSPKLAEELEKQHQQSGWTYIASPVFARPDGITKRQAVFMVSGAPTGRKIAQELLQSMGKIADFGDYLIAASIEAISEAMVFAEKHHVDRNEVMKLLSSTIFDCLIYKGYGQRVSERDHRPGGFALELGYKDVMLVQQAARHQQAPMPFLSVLCDRYTAARAQGRDAYDWSAIGLNVAEDAGLDMSKDIAKNEQWIKDSQKKV